MRGDWDAEVHLVGRLARLGRAGGGWRGPAGRRGRSRGQADRPEAGAYQCASDPKQKEAEKFKELVESKTGGRVKVEIYGAGVLGDVREIIEGLQLGTDEVVIEGFGTIAATPNCRCFDLVPFMFSRPGRTSTRCGKAKLGKKLLAEAGSQSKMKLFGPSYRGVAGHHIDQALHQPQGTQGSENPRSCRRHERQDLAGARGDATPMAMTEVLTGLQQGTVDAQENPPILSYNFGLADVCKNLIRTDHRWSADVFMMGPGLLRKAAEGPPDGRWSRPARKPPGSPAS